MAGPLRRGRGAGARRSALPPAETAHGALLGHITGGAEAETFQPMNVNFGLFPPPPAGTHKSERKAAHGPARAGRTGGLAVDTRFRAHIAACLWRENC